MICLLEFQSEAERDQPETSEQAAKKDKRPVVHPHIRVRDGGYSIVCEQIQVAEAIHIAEAWCLLIVSYFVYYKEL